MLNSILALAIFIIVMIASYVFIPRFLTRRALLQVIAIFRLNNALYPENAKTQEELGLNPVGYLQRITLRRDYKPNALMILINEGVIISTKDDRLYMVEEKLNEFLRLTGLK